MILDTEFLISLRAEEEPARDLAAEIEAAGLPTRVPTIVIEEVYVSVGYGDLPASNAGEYEALIANKPVVPLDENISRRAGALEGQHMESETKPELGPGDAIVAATGLVFNEAVVTNDEEFEDVAGLDVELY